MDREARELICNVKGHRLCDCWLGSKTCPRPEHEVMDDEQTLQPHCRRCGRPYEGKVKEIDVSDRYGLPPGTAINTYFEKDDDEE